MVECLPGRELNEYDDDRIKAGGIGRVLGRVLIREGAEPAADMFSNYLISKLSEFKEYLYNATPIVLRFCRQSQRYTYMWISIDSYSAFIGLMVNDDRFLYSASTRKHL